MSKMIETLKEIAAVMTAKRAVESYGSGRRRKPVQVSSIPGADQFAEESDALAEFLGVDGRSLAAIVAVHFLFGTLGLKVKSGKDKG